MEITGRLTADAVVRKTKGNKEVVSFTVVVSNSYKSKDGEVQEFSEFFNCSYWQSSKVADYLLKGSIVTVTGRTYLDEYDGKDGKHYTQLAFHVNNIKIHAKGGKTQAVTAKAATAGTPKTIDDLPF